MFKVFLAELAKYGILADVPINITSGIMADVVYLRKIISETVNISAGYHSPHTRSERIDFPAMCKIYKMGLNTFISMYKKTII